ncbi:MAG: carbohydrate-binding family 9-like protein [Phycisphaerae bacterium]|nr:carbohydrate-binding family 9-like protein [Phycisphaerae bacterium]
MNKLANKYECRFTNEPLVIDGILDDAAWEKAGEIGLIIPVSHAQPISKTEARVLWDKDYLYVGFKAYDKDIWSYLTEHDSQTCSEDVLEVFFKPHADNECYYNFEINALNTVYDAYNLKRHAGGGDHHRWARWDCEGLKSAVSIKGTLNDPSDVDEYWCLEMAVPFAELPSLKGASPQSGDVWKFHLARYDYSIYLPDGVELTSCAPLTKVDFHHCEDWIDLQFME